MLHPVWSLRRRRRSVVRSVSGALVWLERCGAERVVADAARVGLNQWCSAEAGSGERKGRPVTTRQQDRRQVAALEVRDGVSACGDV